MLLEIVFILACIGTIIYLVFSALFSGVLYAIDLHHEYLSDQVIVSTIYLADDCPQDRPLQFIIRNTGDEVIENIAWSVVFKQPGFSSNLIEDASLTYEEDKILKPDESWSVCYEYPKLKREVVDYSDVNYHIINKIVTFN